MCGGVAIGHVPCRRGKGGTLKPVEMGRRREKEDANTGCIGKENMDSWLMVGAGVIKGRGVPSILCLVK